MFVRKSLFPIPVSMLVLLPLWGTSPFLCLPDTHHVELSDASVKCGIYQGDTLSTLLFCLC